MAYSRHLFTTDNQREKFSMFQPTEIDSKRLKLTTAFQLLSIFLMTRLVMVATGITFINIPLIDDTLRKCVSLWN